MTREPFIHLHNHSQFSLLDGASKLGPLLDRAVEFGMPAIAVTDHGNLFGAVKFHDLAVSRGVKPILGCEAYVAPGSRRDRLTQAVGRQGAQKKPYYHLILLAENERGYANLMKLSSLAYTEGFYYRPRIDKELLAQHGEGLIGTSACLGGEIAQLLLADRRADAERVAGEYEEILGKGDFFLEIQNHGLSEQRRIEGPLVEISRKLGIPLVGTNDCHFLKREDHDAHDVLMCIQTGKTIDDPTRVRYTTEHYVKSSDEMAAALAGHPEAIRNTLRIAERCSFKLEKQAYNLPDFQVPEGYDLEGYFRKVVRDGFEWRKERWRELEAAGALRAPLEAYEKRLKDEMDVICRRRFPAYFLVVWDFIRYAREAGVPVGPGRGSAAGSLVAYCLGITDIDPIPYNLIFERFLNPERVSLPDIDIDFCMRKRSQVIDYVTRRYGREKVAQIITFGTMAARAAIRDVGRGLDIPYGDVDRIAKMIPLEPDATIPKALATVPPLREARDRDPRIRKLIEVAQKLEGLTRHASTHAAGVVIAPRPIVEFAPLYQPAEGEITTQYAKDEIERIGLLKMDFLGLKTLTLIEDVLDRLERDEGERLDLQRLPLDDKETYRLFSEARTGGIFQFESTGMREILSRLKPTRFEDLIALNALFRPGPIKGGLIDDFIKRRHGRVKAEYLHPSLEPILRETYGVIVYQEQVMQIASTMAGYTLGEADILRRAMGKKKKDVMAAERTKFVEGAKKRGIPSKTAREVFALMEHFAGYGFNASHSAAYALIAYRTAYLKAHYPTRFMASLLSIDKESSDNVAKYLREAQENGIRILPADINESEAEFSVENEAIRFGLAAIKKVGESAVESILQGRERVGRYVSLAQLCGEVDTRLVNKGVLEALVRAGAFDGFGVSRARLAAAIDGAMEGAQRAARAHASGQEKLFGAEEGEGHVPRDHYPDVEEWSEMERLAREREALGFYFSGHPLQRHLKELEGLATHSSGELGSLPAGTLVSVGGIMAGLSRRKTRKGEKTMATFKLEDMDGSVEVVVFPELYTRSQTIFMEEPPVLVTGRLETDEFRVRILCSELVPISEARQSRTESVAIRLPVSGVTEDLVERLKGVLRENRGDCPVYLELSTPGEYTLTLKTDEAFTAKPSRRMVSSVEALLGPGSVRMRGRAAPRPGPGPRPPRPT